MTISGIDNTSSSNVLAGLVPGAGARSASAQAASSSAKATTSADTTDTGSSITSNDFLTLLVTEMKNQDPTQPTDPNAYIQQLVEVNSLQQLISINGELGPSASSAATQKSALQQTAATSVI
jgi:flagellar basal-body rod modification protein FlgD